MNLAPLAIVALVLSPDLCMESRKISRQTNGERDIRPPRQWRMWSHLDIGSFTTLRDQQWLNGSSSTTVPQMRGTARVG